MRRFRGWEPRTFYEYDGDRLVSSIPETEWDDESRDLILASDLLDRRTGANGEYLPEALSDSNNPMAYSGHRYDAKGPFTNWFEKERLDAIDAHKKALGKDGNLNGVFFTVDRIEYDTPN